MMILSSVSFICYTPYDLSKMKNQTAHITRIYILSKKNHKTMLHITYV
ncbi:hypothetical protein EMIT07CA2_550069 [Brevibacillus sp. IT-7CA2]